MSTTNDKITIKAQCLCKTHTFTTTIPLSSLPLKATTCHCDSCRYSTGALYSSDVPWPGPKASHSEIRESSLSRYVFSDNLTIRFCGTCGSTMFWEQTQADIPPEETTFGVFTGMLENLKTPAEGSLVEFEHHIFLGDTIDGGASPWMGNLNRRGGKVKEPVMARGWKGRMFTSDEIPMGQEWLDTDDIASTRKMLDELRLAEDKESKNDTIPMRCRCGGVHFELLTSKAKRDFSQMAREDLPRFVDPVSFKPSATFDVCDSCRLSSGLDIFHWTFFWLRHMAFPAGSNGKQRALPQTTKELKYAVLAAGDGKETTGEGNKLGTLRMYESSPDVQRYFCGRCSATVFYAVDDLPDQVDIAVGLLRAPPASGATGHAGARADEFLSWKYGGKLGWAGDVVGGWREGVAENVRHDVEAWRAKRGLAKNWRVLIEEQEADAAYA